MDMIFPTLLWLSYLKFLQIKKEWADIHSAGIWLRIFFSVAAFVINIFFCLKVFFKMLDFSQSLQVCFTHA